MAVFVLSLLPTSAPARDEHLLTITAIVLLYSAAWFVALQLVVLQAICPWCMVEHGLGVCDGDHHPDGISAGDRPQSKHRVWTNWIIDLSSGIVATVAFALFVTAQIFVDPPTTTQRLPEGRTSTQDRVRIDRFRCLQGKLQLAANEEPMLGSADASKLLCLMFDYCCPHCRRTHEIPAHGA